MPIGQEKVKPIWGKSSKNSFFFICSLCFTLKKENISYLDLLSLGNLIWFNSPTGSLHVTLRPVFHRCRPWFDLLDLFLFAPIGASIGSSSVLIRVLSNRCVLQCKILDDILKYFSQGFEFSLSDGKGISKLISRTLLFILWMCVF